MRRRRGGDDAAFGRVERASRDLFPGLTPWATECRPSGLGPGACAPGKVEEQFRGLRPGKLVIGKREAAG
jgi:hypothetical protein